MYAIYRDELTPQFMVENGVVKIQEKVFVMQNKICHTLITNTFESAHVN